MKLAFRASDGKIYRHVFQGPHQDKAALLDFIKTFENDLSAIDILVGYPPQPLSGTLSTPLNEFDLRENDCIIIRKRAVPYDPEMVVHPMPEDNSCLFHAIGYLIVKQEIGFADRMREVVAKQVLTDPTYTEAILGKSKQEYSSWILDPNTWGGAIELAIFSKYYKVEIVSIDIQSLRVDRFGEGQNYKKRCYVLYNVHYDALVLRLMRSSESYIQTLFDIDDDQSMAKAISVAEILNKSRQFTDLANFAIYCVQCQRTFHGQEDAAKHASLTGHHEFREAKS